MSLKESMFVIGTVFDNSFIIQNLYELLPLVHINNFIFIKNKSFPFFGIDDCIVSIVPKIPNKNGTVYETRGIRYVPKEIESATKSFGNSIALDFQCLKKNFHIKLSSSKDIASKFHTTGSKNLEMGKEVTLKLIDYINRTEQAWMPFFRLKYEDRYALILKVINIATDDKKLLNPNSDILIKRTSHIDNDFGEYSPCIKLMLRYLFEDTNLANYSNRLLRICNLSVGGYSIFHNEVTLKISTYSIYLGNYTGNIGYNNIFLSFISEKLLSMGFRSSYFNFKKQVITVKIPIITENSKIKKKAVKNEPAHKFTISVKGAVKLCSPGTPKDAIMVGEYLFNTIIDIINSEEYSKAVLGQPICDNYQKPIMQQNVPVIIPNIPQNIDVYQPFLTCNHSDDYI